MIDLQLNLDNDLLISNFDLNLVRDVNEITQNLKIRLKFILGEWYLDITQGIPYFEDIFIKSPNQIRVETVFQNEILSTEGVQQLTRFSSNYDVQRRKFNLNFAVLVDDQEIEVSI